MDGEIVREAGITGASLLRGRKTGEWYFTRAARSIAPARRQSADSWIEEPYCILRNAHRQRIVRKACARIIKYDADGFSFAREDGRFYDLAYSAAQALAEDHGSSRRKRKPTGLRWLHVGAAEVLIDAFTAHSEAKSI